MKHVILYGPPAVGKLTVAAALGHLTGYGVLHNHLTNNLVREVFPYGHPEFSRLVVGFRTQIIEAAAKARLEGLISTIVYARGTIDDKLFSQWERTVARQGGQTCYVRLHASERTLFKRVGGRARLESKKIISKRQLKGYLRQWDLFAPAKRVASLEIDTDTHSPSRAAALIAKHFQLSARKAR